MDEKRLLFIKERALVLIMSRFSDLVRRVHETMDVRQLKAVIREVDKFRFAVRGKLKKTAGQLRFSPKEWEHRSTPGEEMRSLVVRAIAAAMQATPQYYLERKFRQVLWFRIGDVRVSVNADSDPDRIVRAIERARDGQSRKRVGPYPRRGRTQK